MADVEGVDIRLYRIIYELIDDIRRSLEGLLPREQSEENRGKAVVREVFKVSRVGAVAGCMVTDGIIARSNYVRVIRDGQIIVPTGALLGLDLARNGTGPVVDTELGEGAQQVRETIAFYLANAGLMRAALTKLGLKVYGGVNAPYIWLKTPGNMSSWDFFDKLLQKAHLVGTPGSGFGACGEGYFRLSAFNSRANVQEAVQRFARIL